MNEMIRKQDIEEFTKGSAEGYWQHRINEGHSIKTIEQRKRLKELEEEGISGLVIDVRDNNGGYLSSVTDIANYLLPKGEIIYQIQI